MPHFTNCVEKGGQPFLSDSVSLVDAKAYNFLLEKDD
jgi:hypothetical protein